MESGNTVSLVCSMGDRSVIAENIIRVAGGLEEAENALFSLHIMPMTDKEADHKTSHKDSLRPAIPRY